MNSENLVEQIASDLEYFDFGMAEGTPEDIRRIMISGAARYIATIVNQEKATMCKMGEGDETRAVFAEIGGFKFAVDFRSLMKAEHYEDIDGFDIDFAMD